MASPSGGSSGSSSLLDEDLLAVMDQKKRKRMLSNRQSARRSRMRKHKYLDDLMAEISQLREKNSLIMASSNLYRQNCLVLETENSVLRAQVTELTSWLNSINGILHYINPQIMDSEYFSNPWSSSLRNQPSMASPNMLQYY